MSDESDSFESRFATELRAEVARQHLDRDPGDVVALAMRKDDDRRRALSSRLKRTAGLFLASAVAVSIGALVMLSLPSLPRSGGGPALVPPTATSDASSPVPAVSALPPTSPSTGEPGFASTPVPLAPDVPAEPPSGKCLAHDFVVDGVPPTVEAVTRIASSVIVGTVTGVGPGQWNTPDGDLPTAEDDITPLNVMRFLRIEVQQQVMGEQGAEKVRTVWVNGGTIGCHQFSYSGYPNAIEAGQRYVLFLGFATPKTGQVEVQQVYEMWSIDENDDVSTPEDGGVPLSALVETIRAAGRNGAD